MTLDRPTIPEHYASAIETTHLEVLLKRCPVDYIIAAGWCHDGLGTQMLRLRTEYDASRGSHRQAIVNSTQAHRHALMLQRAAAEANAKRGTDEQAQRAEVARIEAEQAIRHAKAQALTDRALIMVHLKTLAQANVSLHNYAQVFAKRKHFMAQGPNYRALQDRRRHEVQRIAGRVLDVWIDPSCPHCEGRGFNGGYREPVVICEACGGSTNRIGGPRGERLHGTDKGHEFGRDLLDEIDRKVAHVIRMMRKFTSQASWRDSEASRIAQRELRSRLETLRSEKAMED